MGEGSSRLPLVQPTRGALTFSAVDAIMHAIGYAEGKANFLIAAPEGLPQTQTEHGSYSIDGSRLVAKS